MPKLPITSYINEHEAAAQTGFTVRYVRMLREKLLKEGKHYSRLRKEYIYTPEGIDALKAARQRKPKQKENINHA